ncbi:response regulator transcription factor [Dyadobacter jejuensis]|nr:LuxR C-terminal-related transcriptional regulator [Dyadobacter jejuensis]
MHTKTDTEQLSIQIANQNLQFLSEREWAVLLSLTEDITNSEIADKLFITPASVKTYRSRISDKLGLAGRGNLERYARKNKEKIIQIFRKLFKSPPPSIKL